MTDEPFSYDSVPYPSYTFPQTHPDRLATLGSLYGIPAAHPEKCRVLELGCGDGTNLISFAYALPGSEFVGIDLSEVHIAKAVTAAASLDLENVSFRQSDVTATGFSELGEFDFIIAHGLFSWVPDVVRHHILRVFSECLSPKGVGYISYNAYPGCHLREISSGIMKIHTDTVADPREKVEQGMAFLKFVTDAAEKDSLYQMMLNFELTHMIDRSNENVFHDDLSEMNRPFYFRDFTALLDENDLRFFCEADPSASNPARLSEPARDLVKYCGDDVYAREQLIDLITCRRFRASLVCRAEVGPARTTAAASIRDYYLSSEIETEAAEHNPAEQTALTFTGPDGTSVMIDHPLTKAALLHLREIYARNISFDELMAESAKKLRLTHPDEVDVGRTANILKQFYEAGLIGLNRYQPKFESSVSEMPEASRFARWQLSNGNKSVTTLTGLNLKPENEATSVLLSLLDGKRGHSELIDAMTDALDVPEEESEQFAHRLPTLIEAELTKFAEAGLLIA